jgi:hypothetical protein
LLWIFFSGVAGNNLGKLLQQVMTSAFISTCFPCSLLPLGNCSPFSNSPTHVYLYRCLLETSCCHAHYLDLVRKEHALTWEKGVMQGLVWVRRVCGQPGTSTPSHWCMEMNQSITHASTTRRSRYGRLIYILEQRILRLQSIAEAVYQGRGISHVKYSVSGTLCSDCEFGFG